MSKKTEMSGGCNFCEGCGHTWETSDGKRICFNCLRKQRDESALTIAYLRESLRQAMSEISDLRMERDEVTHP